MTKSNFKKIGEDVISVMSSQLCHQKHYQNNVTKFFHFGLHPIKISGRHHREQVSLSK